MHEGHDRAFVLTLRPNDNDTGVLRRRVCPDVGEIQVQRDQDTALALSLERYRRILRSCQSFIGNRVGLEPLAAQYPGAPIRQVLINL